MVKRRREASDSNGATTETEAMTSSNTTTFIDTNLDTHLALIVSDSDTVSDLKKKIMFEHSKCFPLMRELKILSVKVKRKGHYYHLPDTMLVRCAFEGIKSGWFLHVDASSSQCIGNDQGLLCITYPQTEADNLCPTDSLKEMAKQKFSDCDESYPAHGNLASSSTVKQKEVSKVIGKSKSVKPMDNSQELSRRAVPVAKKRKMRHIEDVVNHTVTNTPTSKLGMDNDDSEFKIVGNDITSTNCNEGEQEHINMKSKDVSTETLGNDPNKMSTLGKKKHAMGEGIAEISDVQDERCGNMNNDRLDEPSQSATITKKVKKLGSKDSSRGSAEVNHGDVLKIAIPQNSKAHRPIKTAVEETLEEKSVRINAAHKKKKKKGKVASMCHDKVAARGLEQIDNLLTDTDSTIHVTPSGLEETSPVKDYSLNKGCPAPISKEFDEMNLVGGPLHESIVCRNNDPKTDIANITREQVKLASNCDFEMPMSEKLRDASTKDPVASYQLPDLEVAAENSSGRKKRKAKKSTPRHGLDMKYITEASENAYASGRDKVPYDGPSDATTKVGSVVQNIDVVDHIIEIVKGGKSSVAQGAQTSLPSDNNKTTGAAATEQIFQAEKVLDDKGKIGSGKAGSKKRKRKSHKKSAERIPAKLEGDNDTRASCPSLAAGILPITDHITDQSKKGEILFDAGTQQISLDTEVKESSRDKDLVQVKSAACKSSDCAKAEMTIKEVETATTVPSDLKVAEGHGNSGRSKKRRAKKEVAAHSNDVSGVPSAMHNPPANHFVQEFNQDKNVSPAAKRKGASEQELKSAYAAGSHQEVGKVASEQDSSHNKDLLQVKNERCKSSDYAKAEMTTEGAETATTVPPDLKVAEVHKNSGRSKKRRTKKVIASHTDDVSGAPSATHSPPANHFVQESNQDKNVLPATKRKGASEQESKSAHVTSSHQEVEKGASEQESKGAYAAGSHQEVEKATCIEAEILPIEDNENEIEHLQLNQTDKNQGTVSLVEKKPKKKTKKSQKTSNDKPRDMSPLPEPVEIDVSAKNTCVDQLDVTKSEILKNPGIDSNSKSSGKDLRNTDSFQVPADPLAKGTLEEMQEPEVNTDKSRSINFKQYFIHGQQQGEVAAKKPTKSKKDTKAGRKSKKDGVTSKGTLGDILNSTAEVTVPSPSGAEGDKTFEDVGKLATFDAPAYKEENKEAMDESMSSSSSKGSDRYPENRQQQAGSEIQSLATRSIKLRTGDLEDCTQPEKRLLPTPGPSSEDSRSRSLDCKGGGYSNSSTETPSDYSSSSGYSREASEISQASTPNGPNGAKKKVKSNFLSPNATIDMILRSSSHYKKAKVTAAQCQDDESQPVDVVPDSLADAPNQ